MESFLSPRTSLLCYEKKFHAQVVSSLKSNGSFILEAFIEPQVEMSGVGGPPLSQKELFMSLDKLSDELEGLEFIIRAEVERHFSEEKISPWTKRRC